MAYKPFSFFFYRPKRLSLHFIASLENAKATKSLILLAI
jgi:hypothetical protein